MKENTRSELINLVSEFFRIISGAIDEERDWVKFRKLFTSDAKLFASVKDDLGNYTIHIWSVESYMSRLEQFLKTNDFYEKAEKIEIDYSNKIARLTCNYIASKTEEFSVILKKGVNHINFIQLNDEWKIINSIWEDK